MMSRSRVPLACVSSRVLSHCPDRVWAFLLMLMLAAFLLASPSGLQTAYGQLVFTEVMFDPGSDENRWEWFELHNLGNQDVDLNGVYINRLGSQTSTPTAAPHIHRDHGTNTVIPAGGTAVIFDGDALGFDGQRFRNAWQLTSDVHLIGAAHFPSLTNNGTAVGLWASLQAQVDDSVFDSEANGGEGGDYIAHFDHALTSFDYTPSAFPNGNNAASIAWSGSGDATTPESWARATLEDPGVIQSVATTTPGTEINSPLDVGNPGWVPSGEQRAGLLITEIMYNPRFGTSLSNDTPWEWIEVLNNTGSTLDFSQSGYVLDDFSDAGRSPQEANITLGQIAPGEVALLYDATLSETHFAAAWSQGNGTLNIIPVETFPSLGNSSEGIALWASHEDYLLDRAEGIDQVAHAVVAQQYGTSGDWPSSTQGASIYQRDLASDPSDPASWERSFVDDELGSVNALPVIGFLPDHEGGDLGSPGVFHRSPSPPSLDFNGDFQIDTSDVNSLVATLVTIGSGEPGDLMWDVDQNGVVDHSDLDAWLWHAALANGWAEPYLYGDTNLDGIVNFPDFAALANHWQKQGGLWTGADFTADGVTNFPDFLKLSVTWQRSIERLSATSPVPEPSAWNLLVACCVLYPTLRRLG